MIAQFLGAYACVVTIALIALIGGACLYLRYSKDH